VAELTISLEGTFNNLIGGVVVGLATFATQNLATRNIIYTYRTMLQFTYIYFGGVMTPP